MNAPRRRLRRRLHRRPTEPVGHGRLKRWLAPPRRWRLVITASVLALLPLGDAVAGLVPDAPAAIAPFADDATLAIAKARTALSGARDVGADAYAPAAVAAARARLAAAERWHAEGRHVDAIGQAHLALHAGIKAHTSARPMWMQAQAREAQRAQRQALVTALASQTPTPVHDDGADVEVPVYAAFEPQTARLSASGRARLEAIGDVARSHSDFTVVLATQPAGALPPTDALLTAQSRAQRASAWLEAHGVAPARIRLGEIDDAAGRHLTVRFEAQDG